MFGVRGASLATLLLLLLATAPPSALPPQLPVPHGQVDFFTLEAFRKLTWRKSFVCSIAAVSPPVSEVWLRPLMPMSLLPAEPAVSSRVPLAPFNAANDI